MITLDDIIRNFIITQGRSTLHSYVRYMKYLIDFLRKVSLTHSIFDKTVVLKLDQKKAIQVPEDYIIWSKIGWQAGDRIVCFERDSSINLSHEISDDGLESPTVNISYNNSQWPYNRSLTFNNFTNINGQIGSLTGYGIGENGIGYFRPTNDREIQFSSDVPSDYKIYMEYRTNGFSPHTKSVVPEVMAKLAEEYINWQLARHKLGDAASETRAREISYLKEYDEVISRMQPISMSALQGLRARGYDVNKLVY